MVVFRQDLPINSYGNIAIKWEGSTRNLKATHDHCKESSADEVPFQNGLRMPH